jgi:hypothetical protein
MAKTSLTVEEVVRGQSEPQDDEQRISLRIWEQLPDEWQLEDAFLEQLREVAGLEDYQGADFSALFAGLHGAEYLEVRRAPGRNLREVRRSAIRPAVFYSWEERCENTTGERLEFERTQKERALAAAEDHRRTLESPQRAVERQEVLEHLAQSPVVAEVKSDLSDLEAEVSFLRTRIQLLERRGGIGEGVTDTAA